MGDRDVIQGKKLEQRHGKERVRVGRVWRNSEDGSQSFAEWTVGISLLSDCLPSYFRDDNSNIVATDSIKNTVYVKAKECKDQLSAEDFAILLAKHFTSHYKQVTAAIVNIVEKPWKRVSIRGQPHNHGFELGSDKHMTEVVLKKSGDLRVTSGIQGLSLLKTTKSGFEGFVRDKYTLLPETRERMLATEVSATWRYSFKTVSAIIPHVQGKGQGQGHQTVNYFNEKYEDVRKVLVETFFGPPKEGVYSPSVQSTLYQIAKVILDRFQDIESVNLKMPNIHFLPVNLQSRKDIDGPALVKFEDDVYLPTDEPHGSIEASLTRLWSRL